MEISFMKKQNWVCGTILSTLIFSGVAIADGVQNDISGDVISGHSTDHKDSVLMNPSKAQAPDMGHTNEQRKEDILHVTVDHKEKLASSPGTPPDQHHASDDNAPDVIHETQDHKK